MRLSYKSNQVTLVVNNHPGLLKILFSYGVPVAVLLIQCGKKTLHHTEVKYSSSTTRHINKFIQEHSGEPYKAYGNSINTNVKSMSQVWFDTLLTSSRN